MLSKITRFACLALLTSLALSSLSAPAEARLKRSKKSKAAPSGPLVFRSTGSAGALGSTKKRDRTLSFARAGDRVHVQITDHVANQSVRGVVDVGPDRELVTEDPALANAANIFAVTPSVLRALRAGESPVVTTGLVEANGTLYEVDLEHELQSEGPNGGATVLTRTTATNGKLSFETVARVDAEGVPYSADTRGRLKVFLFNADVSVRLQRVSGSRI